MLHQQWYYFCTIIGGSVMEGSTTILKHNASSYIIVQTMAVVEFHLISDVGISFSF